MAVNFQALLSKPVDETKRPQTKPAGTYFGVISDYKFDESKNVKTPYVRLFVSGPTPGDDVDQAVLQGTPQTGSIDLTKWKPYQDFYLTDDALYRVKDLLESCKIETKGLSYAETIPQLKGQPVMITVIVQPAQSGEGFFNKTIDMKGQPTG